MDTQPQFRKCRPVPFAMKQAVRRELDKLEEQGILERVQSSSWATPVVIVRKKDGSLRVCGDYRCTVNPALRTSAYPLPTVQELLATLRGGRLFSKIDLTQAYQQLRLDDATAEVLTLTTINGLYKVRRLPFGVAVAPLIFQRFMDNLLAGLDGVCVYLDDILITAATEEQHNERLRSVLQRLRGAGLRAKREKCFFHRQEVEFLGYKVDAQGIHPTEEKTRAIVDAPEPTSKGELQAFLGLISFYSMFLKDRATVAESLHRLLDKNAKWSWGQEERQAFQDLKNVLLSNTVLAHYDESKPLILSCDASPYGVGAVLSQPTDHGQEAPVAFASRTLGSAERNYSQLDKEGLAVVFGVSYFHRYIAGREVTIVTDHKPLLGIMGSTKLIPATLSPRMLRWCLLLSAYDYRLVFRPGHQHNNADALSRLPLSSTVDEPGAPADVLLLEAIKCPPLTARNIARWTEADATLRRVYQSIQTGDPRGLTDDVSFRPYRS